MRTTRFGSAPSQSTSTSEQAPGQSVRAGRGVRSLGTVGLVAASAVLLTGCQWTSPVQTDTAYEPADGTSVSMNGLEIKNVVVVSAGDGAPGTVSAMAINNTGKPVTVGFAGSEGEKPQQHNVPVGGSVVFGKGEGATNVTVPQVAGKAGGHTSLAIVTNFGQEHVNAPVLPAEGYYAGLGADAADATASPTDGATATATATAGN